MKFPEETTYVFGCIAQVGKGKMLDCSCSTIRPQQNLREKDGARARLAYHLNKHKIPRQALDGIFVLRTCGHHWCINPEHLCLGTTADSIRNYNLLTPEEIERRRIIESKIIARYPYAAFPERQRKRVPSDKFALMKKGKEFLHKDGKSLTKDINEALLGTFEQMDSLRKRVWGGVMKPYNKKKRSH